MPTVSITPEERQIFEIGQKFAQLQNHPAYKQQLEWMDELVESAKRELDTAFLDPIASADVRNNLGIRYVERRLFRELIARNVNEVVETAKQLAESIRQQEGTLNGDSSGNDSDDLGTS